MADDLTEFTELVATDPGRRELQRQEVGSDIVAAALLHGEFVLNSGQTSRYYFDSYLFETKPTILRRIAQMLAEQVPDGVDRLAGTEVGGIALATAASLETGLPFVIIRRSERSAGQPVRGELHPGELVMLIEDVVDSGSQAIADARLVVQLGATVTGVVAVVDRQAGGARSIAEAGYHYKALFPLSDLNI